MSSEKAKIAAEAKKGPTAIDDAANLKKCLEENNGDKTKCASKIEAFKSASSSPPTPKPLFPISLKRGSLTDV